MSSKEILLAAVLCASVFSAVGDGDGDIKPRIVGGWPARIVDHPWAAAIFHNNRLICGGSIFWTRIIITTAYCVEGKEPEKLFVRLGSDSIAETPEGVSNFQEIRVQEYKVHPHYDQEATDYDVALVHLTTAIQFSNTAKPVRLPMPNQYPEVSSTAYVVGWGRTENGPTNSLMGTEVKIMHPKLCKMLYKTHYTERMMCAGVLEIARDMCSGDQGGPLVREGVLIGIAAFWFDIDCELKRVGSVYMRVSAFSDWIIDASRYWVE